MLANKYNLQNRRGSVPREKENTNHNQKKKNNKKRKTLNVFQVSISVRFVSSLNLIQSNSINQPTNQNQSQIYSSYRPSAVYLMKRALFNIYIHIPYTMQMHLYLNIKIYIHFFLMIVLYLCTLVKIVSPYALVAKGLPFLIRTNIIKYLLLPI